MRLLVLAPFFIALSASARKPCAHKVKEAIPPPRGWKKLGLPNPSGTVTLQMGLPQAKFQELEDHLYAVSDPDHERYGAYLSQEQVNELIAPHHETVDAVTEWLKSHDLAEADLDRSPAHDWVTITVPLAKAESMLNTTYHVWEHDSGDKLVRTTEYSLPEDIHAHIELIQPTTMFARWNGMKTTLFTGDSAEETVNIQSAAIQANADAPPVDASCNATITPKCLRQLYNAVDYKPQAPQKNSIGMTSYLEEYISDADLQAFYKTHVPEAAGSSYQFISVNGGQNDQTPSKAGEEAALDAQYAFGLTYPTKATAWSTAGSPPFVPTLHTPTNTNEPYQTWLDAVLKNKTLPFVISTSYGEEEQSIPISYGKRACQGFAQLGAKGVSVLFSSGDGGVGDGIADPATQVCKFDVNGKKNVTQFMPSFPASCPYVTSVGGTNFIPETAVFFSGGGFSTWFDRPAYQERAVSEFLKKQPKGLYKGLYNPKGRGIPDVAALGRRFEIIWKGNATLIGGTSASAPTFAAFTALLNDARLARGKSPLGFLNPMLYSKGFKGLNDITVGNNPGCGTPGFNATEGWDPVTGLGTPNFGKLLKITA